MKFSSSFFNYFIKLASVLLLAGCSLSSLAKKKPLPVVSRIDPPCWWAGMQTNEIELLVYGPQIGKYDVACKSPGVVISGVRRPANTGYVFVSIKLDDQIKPGNIQLEFTSPGSKPFIYPYEIKSRASQTRGLDPNDLIYLIFPDRFSNGDTSNDAFSELNEKVVDRKGLKSRHGGDIQGIINHLDYLEKLGTTAVWINPVLENNQGYESYHGYAFTDHYKVDPRLGSNELYKSLVDSLHRRGMKVVWDVVYNHVGNEHALFKNIPDSSWYHWFPTFTRTSYRAETLMDPYASEADKKLMTDGWFDKHMPDLNQQDPSLAKYLIQNSIWWIEYAGIDAFRIDTYAYPDQVFMKSLNESILKEYPDFFLFGETWVQGSPVQSWFTEGNHFNKDYSSSLQGVTDFQLYFAITNGLMEGFGWENGFRRIELTLAHDWLYVDPYRNVTHLDNHDLSRFFSMVKEDMAKWKMGIGMLLTLRGIPQVYYGTEILMKNYSDPDAKVREDFPGGWSNDSINKFNSTELSPKEQEAFQFYSTLANYRKNNAWLGASALKQFVPENNTYVYFRSDGEHILMCAYNGNSSNQKLDMSRFSESLKGRTKGLDILSGERVHHDGQLELPANGTVMIEWKN